MKFEKLSDLTSKIGSGVTPKGGEKAYLDQAETVLIRSQNIYNHTFASEGLVYITEEQAQKMKSVEIKNNDILMNITGDSVARVTIAPDEFIPARVNQHVSIIRCKENINPYYLLAVLTSKNMQRYLISIAKTGGTRAALTKKMLEEIEIPILSINGMNRISEIYEIIFNKIELNNQMIDTLEEIASTLFKRWFVDFEFPDENGNPYKSSGGKMIDSELGEIPEGWEVVSLQKVFNQIKDSFNPKKYLNTNIAHFSMPCYDKNQFPIIENTNNIKSNKNLITKSSVLFSKMNPETKRVWLPNYCKNYYNVTSTEFIVVDSSEEDRMFLYSLLLSSPFQNYLISNATGSTSSRQRIRPVVAMHYKFAYSGKVKEQLNLIIKDFSKEIINLRKQSNILETVRDILLPKLLSGDIEL